MRIYYVEELKSIAPNIAIRTSKTHDPYFRWDGDGPDPEEDGYQAYDVEVEAIAIHNGEYVAGRDTLGGSYYKPSEPVGEIHGYLPQMLQEALRDLSNRLPVDSEQYRQAKAGDDYMDTVLKMEYDKQMKPA